MVDSLNGHRRKASYRPYVHVHVQQATDTKRAGRLSFDIALENKGHLPAHITICEIWGGFDGQDKHYNPLNSPHSHVGTCIAPYDRHIIPEIFVGHNFPNPVLPFTLHLWVEYRGVISKVYAVNFSVNRIHGVWEGARQFDTENL